MVLKKLFTEETYTELQIGYDFYNSKLFGGQLPRCTITFQRDRQTMGCFSARSFIRRGERQTDEIVMNPDYVARVPRIVILQTLVQEMVHLWQYHFGNSSQTGYYNREWANKMQSIGLMPSKAGLSKGDLMGQEVETHIIQGGAFQRVTIGLLAQGFAGSWMAHLSHITAQKQVPPIAPKACPTPVQAGLGLETATDKNNEYAKEGMNTPASAPTKAAYHPPAELKRTEVSTPDGKKHHTYSCPHCRIYVWGKPKLRVKCAKCNLLLIDMNKAPQPKIQKAKAKNYYQAELF
jgi:predicted SprT family Zn-dependent metalloprotease